MGQHSPKMGQHSPKIGRRPSACHVRKFRWHPPLSFPPPIPTGVAGVRSSTICQCLNAEYTHVLLVRPCCRIQVSLQDCHDFPQRDRELASGSSAPRKDTFGDTRSICAYNIIVCPRLSMFIFRRTHVGQQCRLWRHCHYLPNYRRLLYFMLALYYKSLLRTDGCLLDICDYL